jgi:hypothetical protein
MTVRRNQYSEPSPVIGDALMGAPSGPIPIIVVTKQWDGGLNEAAAESLSWSYSGSQPAQWFFEVSIDGSFSDLPTAACSHQSSYMNVATSHYTLETMDGQVPKFIRITGCDINNVPTTGRSAVATMWAPVGPAWIEAPMLVAAPGVTTLIWYGDLPDYFSLQESPDGSTGWVEIEKIGVGFFGPPDNVYYRAVPYYGSTPGTPSNVILVDWI